MAVLAARQMSSWRGGGSGFFNKWSRKIIHNPKELVIKIHLAYFQYNVYIDTLDVE